MKISRRVIDTPLARISPVAITGAVAAYALWSLIASGLIPSKYLVAAIALTLLWIGGAAVLWMRQFATPPRQLTARIFSVIMMIILVAGAGFGLYVLHRGLSTLSSLSGGEGAVSVDTSRSFNVFISGIDTYGDIATQARSDVNMVATVNPDTHQVLLTTVPRDAYVSIALGGNDGMDKLTHAGIYGVEASMKTVARLLDTPIDAYVRINFTSFIGSIDTLGGITIDNPTAFTIDGHHFPVGNIELSGEKALLYSRERKSLAAGDIDRGKNQQRVIQGVINELTQIRSLGDFENLLSTIGSTVQTNMDSGTLRSLINRQISSATSWSTESYTLTGRGQTGGLPSHAMPDAQLYMYVLDDESVAKASRQIAEFMERK